MASLNELLDSCTKASENPAAVLEKHLADGKKVIGVMPYYVPEELVYAAGGVPFGVWGAMGTAVEAKKYFPPFYCSICQMTMEMGLKHQLDKLSGMMITALCDTLKVMSQNWKAGCGATVPLIYVSQAQNRYGEPGRKYTINCYREVKEDVQRACDAIIDDDVLWETIKMYNEWRAVQREFVKLAGTHPAEVSAKQRADVLQAGYYLDKREHMETVKQINEALAALPDSSEGYHRIVLSGIYENIPEILDALDEGKFAVVADDLAKESRALNMRVAEEGDDPLVALAEGFCNLRNDSILFDPHKGHVEAFKDKVRETGASGVVILLAKFCDPEEFENPLLMKACEEMGVPCITVDVDQSTESYGQARTQLEAFVDLL